MLFSLVFACAALLVSNVIAGQVPVVDGVVGGVPTGASVSRTTSRVALTNTSSTPGTLRVTENSGVCETTRGVYQASGYGQIATNKSIWFWFFAARKNPATAPVALWLNGGPGSSSMIGLFQEHGPCRINNDTQSVSHNPYSWNNEVNMLYIDQPVGTGFSYGAIEVGTSQEAAADVWSFLQVFFKDKRFAKYQPNNLAIWTESYGGHYGPAFAAHFLKQNEAIATGKLRGLKLNLKVLGIGNGVTDTLVQYANFTTYAASNPYRPLDSADVIEDAQTLWSSPDGCKAQITDCYNGGSDAVCSSAQDYCNGYVVGTLMAGFDFYYVPADLPDPYPPAFASYVNSIRAKVGAEVEYKDASEDVYLNFANTGDWMRNARLDLETVINAGVRTIIYVGDADFLVNYQGVEALLDALNTKFTPTYKRQAWSTYRVHGQSTGQYKNAGTLSYLRVYGAGHEVPAYKYGNLDYGQAAAQMFTQIMKNQPLSST